MDAEIKDVFPVMFGKVGSKSVQVFQDYGCNEMIVRKKLVDEADFTGKIGDIMRVDWTIKRAPIAKIKVDTQFYTETVDAMCMRNHTFDFIIGKVPWATNPDQGDPDPDWREGAAAVTKAQV